MKGLEVLGAELHYGRQVALADVSLSVGRGELVGLLGHNGAGKSSLLDVISGARTPHRGTIIMDGRDITQVAQHERARLGILRTYQEPSLVPSLTVLDNVMLGPQVGRHSGILSDGIRSWFSRRAESVARSAATEVMERLALTPYANRSVRELPLGFRRLVEIARALAANPRMLLLDEIASGLDLEERAQLAMLLVSLAEETDTSILMVEHDTDLMFDISDFVYVLDHGRLVDRGLPDAVRRRWQSRSLVASRTREVRHATA